MVAKYIYERVGSTYSHVRVAINTLICRCVNIVYTELGVYLQYKVIIRRQIDVYDAQSIMFN